MNVQKKSLSLDMRLLEHGEVSNGVLALRSRPQSSVIVQLHPSVEDLIVPRLTNALKSAIIQSHADLASMAAIGVLFSSPRGFIYATHFLHSGGLEMIRDSLAFNPNAHTPYIDVTLGVLLDYSRMNSENKLEICEAGLIFTLVQLCKHSLFESTHRLAISVLFELASVERTIFLTAAGITWTPSEQTQLCETIPAALIDLLNFPRIQIKRVAIHLGLAVWTNESTLAMLVSYERGFWLRKLHPQLSRILLSKHEAIECKYEVR